MDLLTVTFKTGFFADREQGLNLMRQLAASAGSQGEELAVQAGRRPPRILLTGVPVGLGSEKVVRLIEEAGGQVVCFESCGGYKRFFEVDETIDPVWALAQAYLEIPCSVMSPNNGRLTLLAELIDEFRVDGVVDLTWQACHTYNIESVRVERLASGQHGLPFLHLETDYSPADTEQLRVRIEAFLELMR